MKETKLTCKDDDGFRIKRLKRVVKIYKIQEEIMLKSGSFGVEKLIEIESLHDHEGLLTVSWVVEPSNVEMEMIESIWALQYECNDMVEHKVLSTYDQV